MGYHPGAGGISSVIGLDGTLYTAAAHDTVLFLYSQRDGEVAKERVAFDARWPALALDSEGCLHIAFRDLRHQALGYALRCEDRWSTQVVDDSGNVGSTPSIALDSGGGVHISYNDLANGELKYAHGAMGDWTVEILDGHEVYAGLSSSIAIESAGTVHIGYFVVDVRDTLRYATNEGGQWSISIVDSGIVEGAFASLALDSSGTVHIAYSDLLGTRLRHAWGDLEGWETETVDPEMFSGAFCDLEIDDEDNLHIAYHWHLGPRYAVKVDGEWRITQLGDVLLFGLNVTLALGPEGKINVVFADVPHQRMIKLGNEEGGHWGINPLLYPQMIEPPNGYVRDDPPPMLALNSNNVAHVCLCRTGLLTQPGMAYATNESGLWRIEVPDPDTTYECEFSIGLDNVDVPHIFYTVSGRSALQHAARTAQGWLIEQIPEAGDVSGMHSWLFDENDHFFGTYPSNEKGVLYGLFLLTDASGQWERELISRNYARDSKLAIDSQGVVHVAFRSNDKLLYAENSNGEWLCQTLEEDDRVNELSMQIDHDDVLHLVYASAQNDAAKEAVRRLIYMVKADGQWQSQTLVENESCFVIRAVGLQLDSASEPHLFYKDAGITYHLRRVGGQWSSVLIDVNPESVRIDSEDRLHDCHYDGNYCAVYGVFE
ncbi:MAG: hypothetical protein P9M14_11280 [Candidatus Alcyoniella australis]|nr:hypothetical protein [Candidatus Alcyoniella australis]